MTASAPTLLVVDDEPAIQHAFRRAFRDSDVVVRSAATAADALAEIGRDRPDAVVLDVHLPDADGLDAYHRVRAVDARIPVVMITGHGTTDLAIRAIKEGAFEYLLKPVELAELRELIGRAIRSGRAMRTPAAIPDVEPSPPGTGDVLIGRCPAMRAVYTAIGQVAATDATVLILGESGTGKELVARAVYRHSRRAEKPFLAINCAAIPETLLESELFGHERGAFTGADRRREGKFEQANGGTLFLDEVGDMTPMTQAKILRVLQEQRFERVGGGETLRTDVRVIAATNVDLERLTAEGRFRKDLYFRLNVFAIRLPPLRDRGDDLGLLIEHYITALGQELAKPIRTITPEAMAALRAYPWPGNIRELQSAVKQSLLRTRGDVLLADFLPSFVFARTPAAAEPGDRTRFVADRIAAGTEDLYAECVERMEREVVAQVLRHTNGNQLQAARILGITRGNLRKKIRTHGISINTSIESEGCRADD